MGAEQVEQVAIGWVGYRIRFFLAPGTDDDDEGVGKVVETDGFELDDDEVEEMESRPTAGVGCSVEGEKKVWVEVTGYGVTDVGDGLSEAV